MQGGGTAGGKCRLPFIEDRFHGCGIKLEHLGGGVLGVSGLNDSCAIRLSLWQSRQRLVDDQLLRSRVRGI